MRKIIYTILRPEYIEIYLLNININVQQIIFILSKIFD